MFISGTTATDLETTIGAPATATGDIVDMITFPQLPVKVLRLTMQ